MGKTHAHQIKYKLKALYDTLKHEPFVYRFGMKPRDFHVKADHIQPYWRKRSWNASKPFQKRCIHRRIRHKIKDALRHRDLDLERAYRKYDGKDKVKTGYGS